MRTFVCSMLVVLLLGCAHVQEHGSSHDKDAILALELELCGLLERGALDEYAGHLTPDYALTTAQGELQTREQALAFCRKLGPGYKMTPDQMLVRVYGNTAILTARVVGPNGGAGDHMTKTFVRINGRWLLAALHWSEITSSAK